MADHDAFPVGTLVEVVDIPRLKGMHLSVLSGSTVGGLRLSTKTNRLLVPVTLGDGQIFHLHEENLIARSSLLSSGKGGGKTLMGALLPLPLLSLALFRAVDAVYFSPALNQRFAPDLLVLYCNGLLASAVCSAPGGRELPLRPPLSSSPPSSRRRTVEWLSPPWSAFLVKIGLLVAFERPFL